MSKGRFYYRNKNKKRNQEQAQNVAKVLSSGKAKPEDLLRPIEDLQLSERTYNALKAGRVSKLADLACRTMQQMYRIQNIGKKNLIEISKALAKFDVAFAEDNSQSQQNNRNNNNKNTPNQQNRQKDNRGENASLNNYLSKIYEGMTINEILIGKRERPPHEKAERPPLTESSLVKFCRKGKWGYKDWKGNVVIPPTYEEAFGFYEERGCVEKDGKLGYIDRKNNLVIDYQYDCATSFSEGLASVTIGEKSGYIDPDGNKVIDFIYDIATPFCDGKAVVRADDRWGVLNRQTLEVFWR